MSLIVPARTPFARFVATGGQRTFVVPFEFLDDEHLQVFVDVEPAILADTPATASEYSVTGAGQQGGGSISFGGAGLTAGQVVSVARVMPIERLRVSRTSGNETAHQRRAFLPLLAIRTTTRARGEACARYGWRPGIESRSLRRGHFEFQYRGYNQSRPSFPDPQRRCPVVRLERRA